MEYNKAYKAKIEDSRMFILASQSEIFHNKKAYRMTTTPTFYTHYKTFIPKA